MRPHDRYKPMREGSPRIVLQKPNEAPIHVDLDTGYTPEEPKSKSNRDPEGADGSAKS